MYSVQCSWGATGLPEHLFDRPRSSQGHFTPTSRSSSRRGGTDIDARLAKDARSALRLTDQHGGRGVQTASPWMLSRPPVSISPDRGFSEQAHRDGQLLNVARGADGKANTQMEELPDSARSTASGHMCRVARQGGFRQVPTQAHLSVLAGGAKQSPVITRWGSSTKTEATPGQGRSPDRAGNTLAVPLPVEMVSVTGTGGDDPRTRAIPAGVNPANYLSLQLPSAEDNPNPYEGDSRSKYIPGLRGGTPFPISVLLMSDGGERHPRPFTQTHPNARPGAVKMGQMARANPYRPDSVFKSTMSDVTRWKVQDRPNKLPYNQVSAEASAYRKCKSRMTQHFESGALSEFEMITR